MSSSSFTRSVITHREGVSLPLLRKRTRSNKLRHKAILGAVPFEMVQAWDERMSMRYRGIDKRTDPIGNLLMKYEFSPEVELVEAMCRACAQKQFDETVWETIRSRVEDLVDNLNPVDSGLILKNIAIYTIDCPSEKPKFVAIITSLIRKIGSRRFTAQALGSYTLLYGLQTLNHFRDHIDPETVSRYFSLFMNRLIRGDRIPTMHTTGLINTVQAIAHRPVFIKLSPRSVEPFIEELTLRVSQSNPAENPDRDSPDVDGHFGLLSAVAKLSFTGPKVKNLFDSSQTLLLANDHQYLNLLTFEQLAGTAHAFSRLGPATLSGYTDIFRLVGNLLISEDFNAKWTPRIIATVVNAYGTAAVCHEDLMDHISRKRSIFEDFDPMQTAMCIYGLSKLGCSEKFPNIIIKVNEKIPEMNLHSLAKLITSQCVGKPISNSIFSRVSEMVLAGSVSDTDSLVVILQAAVDLGGTSQRDLICQGIHSLESNISKIGNLSRVAKLVHDACILLPTETSLRSFTSCFIDHIHSANPSLSLADTVRVVYGVSVLGEGHSEPIRDQIVSILKRRATEFRTVSYRPLSRLITALDRLGIVDVDLVDVIDEARKFIV